MCPWGHICYARNHHFSTGVSRRALVMDTTRFPQLIAELYGLVSKLEAMFPGRHFTPDGHMVGSIGEALAAYHYGLELLPASTAGRDARKDGKFVEIKATQGDRVAFRCAPDEKMLDHESADWFRGPMTGHRPAHFRLRSPLSPECPEFGPPAAPGRVSGPGPTTWAPPRGRPLWRPSAIQLLLSQREIRNKTVAESNENR